LRLPEREVFGQEALLRAAHPAALVPFPPGGMATGMVGIVEMEPARLARYTYEEYRCFEESTDAKHEYLDGQILAMAEYLLVSHWWSTPFTSGRRLLDPSEAALEERPR